MSPKTIYQVSINLNDDLDDLKQSHEKLMQLNPGWGYFKITSEHQLLEFMQQHFRDSQDSQDNKIYECYTQVDQLVVRNSKSEMIVKTGDIARVNELINIARLVCRTDIFRLAIAYKYGGLYFDLSKQLELNIDKVFEGYDVGFFRDGMEVHSSIVYSKSPRSKYIEQLINAMFKNFELKYNNQMILAGPGLYTAIFGMDKESHIQHSLHFDDPKIKVVCETGPELDTPGIVFKFEAPWKQTLHTPVDGKLVNEHWFMD
jgi:hypothetical protein